MTCEHTWIFTSPCTIRCTQCQTVARRQFTRQERRGHHEGRWHTPYLYGCSSLGRDCGVVGL